jgi:hypothetical protein
MPIADDPPPASEHGPKLSAEELERRIVALYADGPAMPDAAEDLRLRRAEFELAVDHRLGTAFPSERRERLWAAQQRVDRRRFWHLFKGLFARDGDTGAPLTRALVVACARELDANELRDYLELSVEEARRLREDR